MMFSLLSLVAPTDYQLDSMIVVKKEFHCLDSARARKLGILTLEAFSWRKSNTECQFHPFPTLLQAC